MRIGSILMIGVLVMVGLLCVAFAGVLRGPTPQNTPKRELLVYCGITMIKPIGEIAREIERQENCRILITKGGSGNLLRAIRVNRVGDLYLPGSDSYIETCVDEGLVTETALVGHNRAALMVQKGNPRGIPGCLDCLKDPNYTVVIGDPSSGSIGRETKKALDRRGIFDAVAENAVRLTTDSKDLIKVLKDKEADVVVNWFATCTWPENRPYVDALRIDEEYASRKKLVLGLLRFSRHPDIARKFLAYAASAEGRETFRRYGLHDPE